MATTLIEWRPSTLRAAGSPIPAYLACATAQPKGRPVAATVVRSESVYGLVPTAAVLPGADRLGTMKINNYIGTPAAAPALGAVVAGAAMSSLAMAFGDIRKQQLGDDTVKGTDARGIPPRGRRSV